jgi:L-2-hydroxyglutarate oxidase
MASFNYDVTVIGGGIVGIATAMQIAKKYPRYKVGVVEKEEAMAQHQTGHNSGVIHSGIYYPAGSLKATLCVQGRDSSSCWASSHPGRQPHSRSPNVSRA